nr:glutamate-rich protein 2 isoform X5 [Chrysemys picta bellii]
MRSGAQGLPGRQPPRWIYSRSLLDNVKNCLERTGAIKDQKNGQNGRLHVFGPKEEVIIEPIQTMPCMCRRTGEYSQHGWGTNQHGFGPESTNKVYTPTKQISLCAAKSTFEKWDASAKTIKKKNSSRIQETNLRSPQYIQETTDDKEKNSRNIEKPANNELSTEFPTNSIEDHNTDEQLSETTDDDESSSENEDRKINAPIELLGEFLKAIMDQDYSLSKKLCQMILIYEPENTEAKQFLPLLEEKLLIVWKTQRGQRNGKQRPYMRSFSASTMQSSHRQKVQAIHNEGWSAAHVHHECCLVP